MKARNINFSNRDHIESSAFLRRPQKFTQSLFKRLKFMFSKKATKIDEIFTGDLTFCSKCQIYGQSIFVALLENTNFTEQMFKP